MRRFIRLSLIVIGLVVSVWGAAHADEIQYTLTGNWETASTASLAGGDYALTGATANNPILYMTAPTRHSLFLPLINR